MLLFIYEASETVQILVGSSIDADGNRVGDFRFVDAFTGTTEERDAKLDSLTEHVAKNPTSRESGKAYLCLDCVYTGEIPKQGNIPLMDLSKLLASAPAARGYIRHAQRVAQTTAVEY